MYTESDKRVIAYQLARSGCNVAASVKILRAEYESFRNIGDSTVRRLLQNAKFCDCVAEQVVIVQAARDSATRDAERARMHQQLEGSVMGQMRSYNRLLDDAVKHFEQALSEARAHPEHDLNSAVRAFESVAKIVEKLRAQTIPAIADNKQATLLITIFAEEANAMMGPEKAKLYRNRVRERYIREAEAIQPAVSN